MTYRIGGMALIVRAYRRVSTDEQAEEGFSLPVQSQRIVDFCRSQWGAEYQIIWYEDDGFSAKNLNRPALQRLLQEVQPRETVVCLRLDRLTRSVADLYAMLMAWEERGIGFRSVTEPYDTTKSEGKFMIGLLALLAQWERERTAERTREVMAGIMKGASPRPLSKAPLGYDLVDGQFAVNPGEADVVRRVFDLYTGGMGTRAVALELNRLGHRTKSGADWSSFTVAYTLRNPVYVGKLAWNRVASRGKRRAARGPDTVCVEGTHEPLLSPSVWEAAQTLLDRHRTLAPRSAAGGHLLTGVARCALCGGPVHGVTQRRGSLAGGQVYYRCSRRDHGQTCRLPWFRAEALERAVVRAIGALGPAGTLADMAAALLERPDATAHRKRVAGLRARLRQAEKARATWDSLLVSGDLTQAEWRERSGEAGDLYRATAAELERLEGSAPVEVSVAEVVEALRSFPACWAELEPSERRVVLQGLVRVIYVHQDGSVQAVPVSVSCKK